MATTTNKSNTFWIFWGSGVFVLALLVWLSLRFVSAYTDCVDESCISVALRDALFFTSQDKDPLAGSENKFVKYLIKPPADKQRPTDAGIDSKPGGPLQGVDRSLAKRLAEQMARNASALGLLRPIDGGSADGNEDCVATTGNNPPTNARIKRGSVKVRGGLSRQAAQRSTPLERNQIPRCRFRCRGRHQH